MDGCPVTVIDYIDAGIRTGCNVRRTFQTYRECGGQTPWQEFAELYELRKEEIRNAAARFERNVRDEDPGGVWPQR